MSLAVAIVGDRPRRHPGTHLPTLWSGRYSLAGDGRGSLSGLDWLSTLHRVAFDPTAGNERRPLAVLEHEAGRSRPRISPDGQWIVFSRSGVQEDLFLTRIDGSQCQATDGAFRDRGPSGLDGRRIASDRSGAYEHWVIHPTAAASGS
jgi:hypothetical protein